MKEKINTYNVEFQFTREDGSVYKDIAIVESYCPARAKSMVEETVRVIRPDVKVGRCKLRHEGPVKEENL